MRPNRRSSYDLMGIRLVIRWALVAFFHFQLFEALNVDDEILEHAQAVA